MASLKNKTLSSGLIIATSNIASQIFRLMGNLVLTRLLMPEIFGLMSVAYTIQFGLNLFSDIGLSQNLIQSGRSHEKRYINTLWTLQVLRGVVITLLGIIAACTVWSLNQFDIFDIHTVYANPQLPLIIVLITINQFILGFQSTNAAFAIRNLNVMRKTMLDLLGQVLSLIITIAITYFWRDVWALIIGGIINSFFTVYVSHRYLGVSDNRFDWDVTAVKDIIKFGKWVFLSSAIGFLYISGDRFMLGGLVSARTLGLYTTAYFLSNALMEMLNRVFSFAAFPALSEVYRTKPENLRNIYYRLRLPVDVLCLLTAGVLYITGHIVIDVLYDDRYAEAGVILEILSLSLAVSRFTLAEQCYLAMGKPELLVRLNLLRAIAIIVIMPIVLRIYGFHASLYVIALNGVFSLPLVFFNKMRWQLLNVKKELYVIPVFFIGLLIGKGLEFLYNCIGRL
ncbi:oligosaccharide flippase family protein [Methylophilus aquaticus]|uniref:Oligosaccharide flippase family protein n=1 Tax=Methylophilus aquaticus TaxID=1971610 RepID=A0ABT9JT51_9PROT|nr:oligosaccharide flippase family protein [Methylophilus aquaticus]MDP8567753.1 oligosaccharide flippase family protein [Methylophilus aquaticus]